MITYLQKIFARLLFILIFITALCSYDISFAQVSFTAECPQKKIGKNDYLQIQFKVDHATNVESINPPSFKNFSVVSGPNQESGMTSINGKTDQYVSIGYVLKPNGPGNYTIGPATAKADGKELRSDPLNVVVTNASTPSSQSSSSANSPSSLFPSMPAFPNFSFDMPSEPTTHRFDDYILKKGENVTDKVKKNLFIKLDVNKTTCYVGQPIIAAFKLYTRLRSESTITSAPSFNGFSVSELDLNNNNSSGVEKVNGREYNVYTLRKVQLYPLQPGTIRLDSIVADNKVTFIKADYANSQNGDMFFNMMQNFADATSPSDAVIQQTVTLKSKPVEITVKPLPEENKPVDFKGSVGEFAIQSSLQKDNLTTDDAGNLKIIINGTGNIQLINAPKINWPQGMDGYDAKIKDGIDKLSVPMKGSKTFTYPFTVSAAGNYIIPAISFSYFNPESASYKTITTQPLTVHVTKGKGVPNNPYVKNAVQNTRGSGLVFIENYGLYLLAAVVILAILVFGFSQRKNTKKEFVETNLPAENTAQSEPEEKFIIPENPLEEAYEKLMQEDSRAFYNVLDVSLKKYLSAKFKVPLEEISRKRVSEELDNCNVGLGTSIRLSNLMENIELNLYAPPSNVNEMKQVYEKAAEVISLLDKQC